MRYLNLIMLGAILALSYSTYNLYEKNKLKDTIISMLNNSIAQNNQTIKKLEIDIENFKTQEPIIKEKIITKYKTIKATDTKCENQIKAVDEALNAFFNR